MSKREFFRGMETFIILIVWMSSLVYTLVKMIKLYTLNRCSLLYAIKSIKSNLRLSMSN